MISERKQQDIDFTEQELTIEELGKASGGFNIGKFVLDTAKAELKEIVRSQGCLGPTIGGFDTTKSKT